MNNLNYSPNAKINASEFSRDSRNYRVYVEGSDDIPFWADIFEKIQSGEYKPIIVYDNDGGIQELIKKLEEYPDISRRDFIIAMDGDYDDILKNKPQNDILVIKTKRYAIENYLFCPNTLKLIIRNCAKKQSEESDNSCELFYENVSEIIEPLLYLDCLKQQQPILLHENLKILGRETNIANFCENNKYLPLKEKVTKFIKDNKLDEIEEEKIDNIKELFKGKKLYHYINGHFMIYLIFTFLNEQINKKIKESDPKSKPKIKLGRDNLYILAYCYCPDCNNICEDYKSIIESAQNAVKSVMDKINQSHDTPA